MSERNSALTRCAFVCVQSIADAEGSWEIAYPVNVIQFLCLIYHSYTQDPMWHCPDFLKTLAMVAFHSGPPKVRAFKPTQTLQIRDGLLGEKNRFEGYYELKRIAVCFHRELLKVFCLLMVQPLLKGKAVLIPLLSHSYHTLPRSMCGILCKFSSWTVFSTSQQPNKGIHLSCFLRSLL